MLTWLLVGVGTVVVIVLIALAVGTSLPRDHVATVRVKLAATPEAVWAVISDPSAAASWRTDVKAVVLLPPAEGRTAWQEQSGFGVVRFVMAEFDPPRRMVSRITNDDLPYGGQWEYVLARSGTGTELSVTERGFVKPPLFR